MSCARRVVKPRKHGQLRAHDVEPRSQQREGRAADCGHAARRLAARAAPARALAPRVEPGPPAASSGTAALVDDTYC